MNKKEGNDCRNCGNCEVKSPLFSLLGEKELELIDQNRVEVMFKAGEVIRKQGTFLSHVISLHSGLCKIYFDNLNQQNIILRIIKPTNFIGGPGMYIDQKSHYSVAAITDSSVCLIAIEIFKQIMHSNNVFADEFVRDMSRDTLITYNRLLNLTQKQMSGRIADALLYLSDEIFKSRKYEMILSKNDLADYTGMTKDNAVKVLQMFKRENLINIVKNDIEILDYDSMQRIRQVG